MYQQQLKRTTGDSTGLRYAIRLQMAVWQNHLDLVGIRDESKLSALPEAESEQLRKFWAEVRRFRDSLLPEQKTTASQPRK